MTVFRDDPVQCPQWPRVRDAGTNNGINGFHAKVWVLCRRRGVDVEVMSALIAACKKDCTAVF